MVRIEDLMVGNFAFSILKGEKKCFSVTDIMTRDPKPTRMVFSEDENLGPFGALVSEGSIEGIPVTKEILKNIGFEEQEDFPIGGVFYRYWDKDYKYKLDVDEGYTNSGAKWYVHIDNDVCNTIGSGEFTYVHELQNLVRINCKADLPITKEMIDGLESR